MIGHCNTQIDTGPCLQALSVARFDTSPSKIDGNPRLKYNSLGNALTQTISNRHSSRKSEGGAHRPWNQINNRTAQGVLDIYISRLVVNVQALSSPALVQGFCCQRIGLKDMNEPWRCDGRSPGIYGKNMPKKTRVDQFGSPQTNHIHY